MSSTNDRSWERSFELLDRLPTLPSDERLAAVEELFRSDSPMVRDRALRTGAVVVPDDQLVGYLRSDADDVVRNAGLEMLKLRGARGVGLAVRLLRDGDPDVVLQAVLALGHTRDLRALEPLRGVLDHPDPNVVQAAIEAVGRLGDARAVPDLVPFLSQDPWLQMAAIQALGDLRDGSALAYLSPLLTDLLVGPLAAEAIARIGGPRALALLAGHLVEFGEQTDVESLVSLLAHVVEGLRSRPSDIAPLVVALQQLLTEARAGGARGVATAASRCLACLGPTPSDLEVVATLAEGDGEALHLPACLERRADLATTLLERPGKTRCWGFLLVERWPRGAPEAAMLAALADVPLAIDLCKAAGRALDRVHSDRLAAGLLELYARATPDDRRSLLPLVATQRRALSRLLRGDTSLGEDDRLLVAARAGVALRSTARAISALPAGRRYAVLEQLVDVPELVELLPWGEWLEEDPERWVDLAAAVAGAFGRRELLGPLRARLEAAPTPTLLRAVGELGDRDSVAALTAVVERADSRLVPLALEALGRIGGPEARSVLRRVVGQQSGEERIAYRALSMCAVAEDDEIFRSAAGHADWYVRLSCAEVLGRYARAENLEALAHLASDPVPLVAQRALSLLDS